MLRLRVPLKVGGHVFSWGSHMTIDGTRIGIEISLKYLGLLLDARWHFREHLTRMVPRLTRTAATLKRLFSNLGRPVASSRDLYVMVVCLMTLYRAPMWTEALTERTIALLRCAQRIDSGRSQYLLRSGVLIGRVS